MYAILLTVVDEMAVGVLVSLNVAGSLGNTAA